MKIRRLADWPSQVGTTRTARPTCQHDVQVVGQFAEQVRKEWHAKGARRYKHIDRPEQCTFPAVVELDDTPLCRRHAGQVALDHLFTSQGES